MILSLGRFFRDGLKRRFACGGELGLAMPDFVRAVI